MLSVLGVEKSYGSVRALRGASLEVAAGSIVSLLGRNGAGKSTLLSVIAGLTKADAGSVHVNGVDVLRDPRKATGLIGIAPQETGVYAPLTVRENLEFFGELAGMKRADRRRRAAEVADQLGLTELLQRRASKLSGGEARRLHTGCALMHRPKLLMLDEPTVGADVSTRAQLIDAVKSLAAEGAAVVYTTHYLPEVEALDASIAIIHEGTCLASGTKEELMAAHRMSGLELTTTAPLPDKAITELGASGVGPCRYRMNGAVTVRDLLDRLDSLGATLESVETLKPDLESVFLTITGAALATTNEEAAA